MIHYYVSTDQTEFALQHAFREEVVEVGIDEILSRVDLPDERRLVFMVMSVKNPKTNHRPLLYVAKHAPKSTTYHRLVLCRELRHGTTFYLLTEDKAQSDLLFAISCKKPFVGSTQAIYNPDFEKSTIYGLPKLECEDPLVPAVRNNVAVDMSRNIPDLSTGEFVTTFLYEVQDLKIDDPKIVPACSARFCDGRHRLEGKCPCVASATGGEPFGFACRLSSRQWNLERVPFCSTEFGYLFLAPGVLKSTMRQGFVGLLPSIRASMELYAGKKFLVAGRFKRNSTSETGARRVYVSTVELLEEVEDVLLYRPPVLAVLPGATRPDGPCPEGRRTLSA